nr:MAG: AtpZ/AtpI family protein [Hyphomicrobiales bacterium]
MSDHDPDPKKLLELEIKLRKAHGRKKPQYEDRPPSKLGIAFRLSTEFVAAPVVGGAIGWGLDRLFGTMPVLLLVMFCLGIAAGFRNLLRAAKEMNESEGE